MNLDPVTEQAQEAAWIATQVAAMPTPSRRDAQVWAALLDIRALLMPRGEMGRAS